MAKKKIGIIVGMILFVGILGMVGFTGIRFFLERVKKIEVLEKENAELREEQGKQKKYIDYLFTYDWKMYFKKDVVGFRYPKFGLVCEPAKKEGEIFNIKTTFLIGGENFTCADIERMPHSEIWPIELKQIKNTDGRLKTVEDVLKAEGINEAENITTTDSKNKYPRLGGEEFLTEWFSGENNMLYVIVIFYPPKPEENYYPPITIIKAPNQIQKKHQEFLKNYTYMDNYPIVELILKSIQFP